MTSELPARPLPEEAVLVPENATKVFTGEIFDVYQWQQMRYDGTYATFEMLKRPDTVSVLPVTEDGKLWVMREEQPRLGVRECYLPGGRMDVPGESVLDAAKRECEEEIGVRFKTWRYIESIQPEKKIDWFIHLFIATDPYETVPTRHDAGEKIEIFQTTYEEYREKGLSKMRHFAALDICKTLDELLRYN